MVTFPPPSWGHTMRHIIIMGQTMRHTHCYMWLCDLSPPSREMCSAVLCVVKIRIRIFLLKNGLINWQRAPWQDVEFSNDNLCCFGCELLLVKGWLGPPVRGRRNFGFWWFHIQFDPKIYFSLLNKISISWILVKIMEKMNILAPNLLFHYLNILI